MNNQAQAELFALRSMRRGRRAPGRKWFHEKVDDFKGSIDEMKLKLPRFERRPFTVAPQTRGQSTPAVLTIHAVNQYHDVIVNTGVEGDRRAVPVGLVSKNYGLVQHTELFNACVTAMNEAKVKTDKVKVNLTLSEHRGRMEARFIFPEEFQFDPGDKHPVALSLLCYNSVDRSSRLWLLLGWFRLICSNGLILGTKRLNVKLVHNREIDLPQLTESLRGALGRIKSEKVILKKWATTPITHERLTEFVDGPLRRRWGVVAASRVLHICQTGHDGKPADPFEKSTPSVKTMKMGLSGQRQ